MKTGREFMQTSEYRKKIRQIALKKGYGKWMVGKKHTELTKQRMSNSRMGHITQPETIRKIREAQINKPRLYTRSEKHWNWQGGKSKERNKAMNSIEYTLWRVAVFTRDNYTCMSCGIKNGLGKTTRLEAHHIKSWSKFPSLRYAIDNGKTLCANCHRMTVGYGTRNFTLIEA